MKTVLYMGISVNGLIAKADGDVSWNSEAGWQSFYDHGSAAGNFIMGANTYDVGISDGTFPFEGALNIVLTHRNIENKWGDKVIFTDKAPREVLALAEEKGFETAFVIGGGQINNSFIKENLIDEIYLDIEPLAFGKGVPLFDGEDFEIKLKLLGTKSLSDHLIQLHYQVIK